MNERNWFAMFADNLNHDQYEEFHH